MAANPYPNLGWNPVPGIPDEVNSLRQKVSSAATALRSCHTQLDKLIGESSYWEGDAAKAFREAIDGELPTYIKNAARSLEKAAAQLSNWDGYLTSNRDLARKYDDAAAEKKAAVTSAKEHHAHAEKHPDLGLAGQQFPTQEEADAATARLRAAERNLNLATIALNKANGEYNDIIAKAEVLEHTHTDNAETVAKSLDDATDKLAPREPGWLSKAVDAIWDGIKATGEFLLEHAGTIGAIAGLLALFPTPLAPLFAGIALVASGVSMGKNFADDDFREAFFPWGDKFGWNMDTFSAYASFGGDALGMVPGVKALTAASREIADGLRMADEMGVAVKNVEKVQEFGREFGHVFKVSAKSGVDDAWEAASNSATGSAKLMANISANGLNVVANSVSSLEEAGVLPKEGSSHNFAEFTKAGASLLGLAGELKLV
ncbi:WXG100 family type VII secretion target [Streptomyces sp. NPDC057740]|uniref:WXG100 family type VII secretion target n=1 Tax=Streptomyces sp. NPDC057740 TaxID=3346234 RepID=UPI0036D04EF6